MGSLFYGSKQELMKSKEHMVSERTLRGIIISVSVMMKMTVMSENSSDFLPSLVSSFCVSCVSAFSIAFL